MYKDVIAIPRIADWSRLSTFFYTTPCTCVSAGLVHLSLQGYRQLDAGCLGLKLQTNKPVLTPCF